MQNFAGIKILTLGAALVWPGSATLAAAPVPAFDMGYGWDAGFAYASPGQPGATASSHFLIEDPAGRTGATALRALATDDVVEATAIAQSNPTVPVPGSLILFGSGLVMLAIAGRRRSSPSSRSGLRSQVAAPS